MRHQVFLSYSFKDIRVVRRLRDVLALYGVDCWPERILTPGTAQWRANARMAVAQAACVLVVLSPDTLWSLWVAMVLEYADAFGVPVVPVLVDGDAGHTLLVRLKGSEWFDLRRGAGYRAEIADLVDLIRFYAQERIIAEPV